MGVKLFRVILPVTDIERATEFYRHLLQQQGERVSSGRHYFECGGTILACYDAIADTDPQAVGANPEYFYFAVDDLESMYKRAAAAGCSQLDAEIKSRPWGERSFYAHDPFGNPICFVDEATAYTGGNW